MALNGLVNRFVLIVIGVSVLVLMLFIINRFRKPRTDKIIHKPSFENIVNAEKSIKITTIPETVYSYDSMKVGVLQHVDRNYTYDVIPGEVSNCMLFQGIHRLPSATTIKIEVLEPMVIYFFFHDKVDGGYSNIFLSLEGWQKCDSAPQYDIKNGTHGLTMKMYKLVAEKGIYTIPPTHKEKACFNIAYKLRTS